MKGFPLDDLNEPNCKPKSQFDNGTNEKCKQVNIENNKEMSDDIVRALSDKIFLGNVIYAMGGITLAKRIIVTATNLDFIGVLKFEDLGTNISSPINAINVIKDDQVPAKDSIENKTNNCGSLSKVWT